MTTRVNIFAEFKMALVSITNNTGDIINSFLPQRGNSSDDCQMLMLRNATSELDHCISGTTENDMRPADYSEMTDNEEEWGCTLFDKNEAIRSIDKLIEELTEVRENLADL